ncbi:MAG: hypothetical protein ABR589_09895 [Chthoniobacterales bacterium]
MSLKIAAKRQILLLGIAAGVASLWAVTSSFAKQPCPLSTTYGTTSRQESSPPAPKQYEAVFHNGKVLCLPPPAAAAHRKHGDPDRGPCNKPGNQK